MTKEEKELWQKIDAFALDEPGVSFSFSQRLAKENGWSCNYTNRVIAEYKKFIFLCCITETGVTPSDPVDQAWHLHLTFTRSYWVDLCQNTLGRQVHHNPTKGGEQEAKKFDSFYTSSQTLYIDAFETAPPEDIWHNNQQRFSDIDFQRVNMKRNWVIRKPRIPITAFLVLAVVFGICGMFIQAIADYGAFLFMLCIFIAITIGVYKWESNPEEHNGKRKRNDGSGCSTAGCGGDASHQGGHDSGHHGGDGGHSGCSSGCSGCSSSGCSGCSGCGGGGD
ncbi:glycine-rich domain-containing protein [Mucilaginibacter pedocola]|uniref:TIGR04222 domain-containing membrane protein n=1 Tax=Mucilaginibacter pedocola TaxID=1792845 RepID=A0A1S9P904_9SPHI|nr:hypothetical protein [Mucilaginibacter pedocola]OOQ57450.1 hypothetical protein BC343_15255 [Mucilaginibacter pedocola]